jgi:hypothetical protein
MRVSDSVEGAGWLRAYVESRNRVAGMLTGIRRRSERGKGCLKVLVDASGALTSRAPAAIGAPSAEHAIALAEIAGAAWAARDVLGHEPVRPITISDPQFEAWLARRSCAWGGKLAPGLMAASDGDMEGLLYSGALPELQAAADAGRRVEIGWLVDPAFRIDHGAAFLAELNAGARPRPAAVHQARAEALDQQLAATYGYEGTHISAHAFAVHYLTGIYGPGGDALRTTMLHFIATFPPPERATLQASKVAALLSDALGPRARMELLDQVILLLAPSDGDPSRLMRLASDSALVLLQLLLEEDDVEPGEQTEVAMPVAVEAPRGPTAQPPADGPDQALPLVGGEAADGPAADSAGRIAEIASEAERAIVAASAERLTRYQRAVDAGSLTDALVVVRDAAADDDHEQAWLLLQDVARRNPDADPGGLVTVAPDILGPVDLESDGDFDGPGAGCFTVLSPGPAAAAAAIARVAPRLLNVDDRGNEHPDSDTAAASDAYTPNFLHGVVWCDRGAQVALDTKGSMSAPMARTMVAILSQALVENRVPGLITGWIPGLDDSMARWDNDS